jgi:hypothetical protein
VSRFGHLADRGNIGGTFPRSPKSGFPVDNSGIAIYQDLYISLPDSAYARERGHRGNVPPMFPRSIHATTNPPLTHPEEPTQ